ncbi:MAG: hypothetical protein KC766_25830 [Myxococcales bacterium]|nr:hypothetical protein [Myxococcales bacterium]
MSRFRAAARLWQPPHGLIPRAVVARFTASPSPIGWLIFKGSLTAKRPVWAPGCFSGEVVVDVERLRRMCRMAISG